MRWFPEEDVSERSGLEYDAQTASSYLSEIDERLALVISRVGAFELKGAVLDTPFLFLLRAISGQQLSRTVANIIFQRLVNLLPDEVEQQPGVIATLSDESLRAAGLSRAKTASIKDLAARTIDGTLPTIVTMRGMTDEEVIASVTRVKGIGRWTAEMLLIFHLGRPDVLPVDDLGLRKGFKAAYDLSELPKPAFITEYGEQWRPYRSVATWYLWRYLDLQ